MRTLPISYLSTITCPSSALSLPLVRIVLLYSQRSLPLTPPYVVWSSSFRYKERHEQERRCSHSNIELEFRPTTAASEVGPNHETAGSDLHRTSTSSVARAAKSPTWREGSLEEHDDGRQAQPLPIRVIMHPDGPGNTR